MEQIKQSLKRIEEKLEMFEKNFHDIEIKTDKCFLIAKGLSEKV